MAQRCPRIRLVKAKRWTGQCWTRPDFTVSLLSRIKMVEILNAWNRLRNVILYSTRNHGKSYTIHGIMVFVRQNIESRYVLDMYIESWYAQHNSRNHGMC